jgi:hypothetical protein
LSNPSCKGKEKVSSDTIQSVTMTKHLLFNGYIWTSNEATPQWQIYAHNGNHCNAITLLQGTLINVAV